MSFFDTCTPLSLTCFGANPGSPYGKYILRTPILDDFPLPIYQLGPSDAVVFLGCLLILEVNVLGTPPPARYFGIQTYAVISDLELLFASIGDSQNLMGIKTSSGQSAPFDRTTMIITTGDQNTEQMARKAFAAAGVDTRIMNSDIISNPKALGINPLGLGWGYSVFATLFRLAYCEDKGRCQQYMDFDWPLIRIRPKNDTVVSFNPFPLQPEKKRGTGTTEAFLNATFATIVNNVVNHYSNQGFNLISIDSFPPLLLEGRDCIKQGTNCIGDTRDANYMDGSEPLKRAPQITPNGPFYYLINDTSDFLLMIGVIHNHPKVDYPTEAYH